MSEQRYVRKLYDGDFPESLFFTWEDRNELYSIVAYNISEALKDILISISKKHAKLAASVSVEAVNDGIEIDMDKYGEYIDLGTPGRFMVSHVGKSIPIKTDDGRTIIRKVTSDSIARGKWYNPGIKPTNFVEHAIEEGLRRTTEGSSEIAESTN